MEKRIKKGLIAAVSVATALVMIAAAFFIYVGIYYHADTAAVEAYVGTKTGVSVDVRKNCIIYSGAEKKCGIIFYPGGKVEHTAYAPLMTALAAKGYCCVLLKMPFRLAVLDPNAAADVPADLGVERLYLAGHSLGGSMAAQYVKAHGEGIEGLILLASYSVSDLSETSLRVLSVYGSEDGVLNKEKYTSNKKNLPASFSEEVIEGGCHAYFGMYGAQRGDGTPKITAAEQTEVTAALICSFIEG